MSREDAINELCNSIYQLKEDNCKYTIGIFFDIMGAFDNLWWPSLLRVLKKIELHSKLWKVVIKTTS